MNPCRLLGGLSALLRRPSYISEPYLAILRVPIAPLHLLATQKTDAASEGAAIVNTELKEIW